MSYSAYEQLSRIYREESIRQSARAEKAEARLAAVLAIVEPAELTCGCRPGTRCLACQVRAAATGETK